MKQLDHDSIMADVLATHNELIPVLNRFGIRLGVGNRTLLELCGEHELNPDFILTVLNVYLDESYLPDTALPLFDTGLIADYFHRTVENYIDVLVPNIEKHLNAFIALSGTESRELGMLRQLFLRFSERMAGYLQRMADDEEDDLPDDLLHDLKNILIKHLSPEYNQNLAYATIFSVHSLEKDLSAHNRLRNKVLRPKLNELDHSGIRELRQAIHDDHHHPRNGVQSRSLTNRETEILRLIVQGHTNREIAEELVISHNTVLTHRKNIIAKTGIKTVSGLTFYCIRNGLISL
ncbi:MAG: LuxR C-terminal-related transcriptional regulator [bacterium]|nr:LuxR C-terminal-related transcriptional regulator [bacterium]MDD3624117.1 LuxR C-terminal-related transcriptional regulator [Proteiniphilum sp.]MDD3967701.1 LuxR C-terminal-related transcriptional regulator [Proteiniphilum sp.]MDD4458954.1 LuxR C-terminal-related transcriptional regulator [Proteiniphilum sp.]